MPSPVKTLLAALAFLAATTTASQNQDADIHEMERRAATQYQTITRETTITTTTITPYTINTDIPSTGVYTLITGALTLTFNNLPAYMYLETTVAAKTSYVKQIISKIAISSSSSSTNSKTGTTSSSSSHASTTTTSSSSHATTSTTTSRSSTSSSTSKSSSSSTSSSVPVSSLLPNCGIKSDGPYELGWETTAGNFPASSWQDCYWTCMTEINYCSSFGFATNGAMPTGQECVIMKAKTTAAGIWQNVGTTKGDWALYDATCTPPVATKPVAISSKQCAIPYDVFGGPTVQSLQDNQIGSFGAESLAECKGKCVFFKGYCASYTYFDFGSPAGAYSNCDVYNVTIETAGAYSDMNVTGDFTAYDAGC